MKRLFASLLMITAAGCASQPQHKVSLDANVDLAQEIASADQNTASLKNQQADVLAPKSYSKAERALDQARTMKEKGKSDEQVRNQIGLARGYEADAQAEVECVHETLKVVLENREQARRAGADRLDAQAFAKADGKLSDLAADLRDGKTKNIGDRINNLNEMYLASQGRSAVTDKLGQARKTIDRARKEGAWKWAPTTLKETELQYDQSEKTVLGSPGDEKVTDAASRKANAVSAKLLTVNREAQGLIRARPEEIVLRDMSTNAQYEKERLAREQELERTRGLAEQTNEERLAAEMKAARLSASATAAQAESEEQRLAAERARRDAANSNEVKAAQIRKNFTKDEADVFTTDDGILIRLRGLRFASNKSVLTPKQYPLIAKVKKSLEEVDAKEIIVAGHTDAVGSKEKNQTLSKKRAESVKSLLMMNESSEGEKIESIGYGYEQPITSNKTASGRAENRRIDITIKTE